MLFIKNGYYCIIEKNKLEIMEHFIERGYFIVSQKPISSENYNNIITYSNIYINNKYFKCEYDDIVMNKLNSMIENMN